MRVHICHALEIVCAAGVRADSPKKAAAASTDDRDSAMLRAQAVVQTPRVQCPPPPQKGGDRPRTRASVNLPLRCMSDNALEFDERARLHTVAREGCAIGSAGHVGRGVAAPRPLIETWSIGSTPRVRKPRITETLADRRRGYPTKHTSGMSSHAVMAAGPRSPSLG